MLGVGGDILRPDKKVFDEEVGGLKVGGDLLGQEELGVAHGLYDMVLGEEL